MKLGEEWAYVLEMLDISQFKNFPNSKVWINKTFILLNVLYELKVHGKNLNYKSLRTEYSEQNRTVYTYVLKHVLRNISGPK
jgi:hypothetical protein